MMKRLLHTTLLTATTTFAGQAAFAGVQLGEEAAIRAIDATQPLDRYDGLLAAADYVDAGEEIEGLWGVEVRAYSRTIPQYTLNNRSLTLVVSVNESIASGILHSQAFEVSLDHMLFKELTAVGVDFRTNRITLETLEVEPDGEGPYYNCYETSYKATYDDVTSSYTIDLAPIQAIACG